MRVLMWVVGAIFGTAFPDVIQGVTTLDCRLAGTTEGASLDGE
jgi:hypothetical protein